MNHSHRKCRECLVVKNADAFLNPRSTLCRRCVLPAFERENGKGTTAKERKAAEQKRRQGINKQITEALRHRCAMCDGLSGRHLDGCPWKPRAVKGLWKARESTYVPKARYEYTCSHGHDFTTNLAPERAFCVHCHDRSLTLISVIEGVDKGVDAPAEGGVKLP